jgi:succinate dehydrogenase / fumarate reductase, flavoprotein subunit
MGLENEGKIIETDVLVIGGGIGGLWAGLRAKAFTNHVLIVDKGPVGYTSQAYFAIGGHQAFFPEDDIDSWVKDVVYIADGLVEQDIVEAVYKQSYERVGDYQRLGVGYQKEKTADGIFRGSTRGLDHVKSLRPHPFGNGGENMIKGLVKEANRFGVGLLKRMFITSLIIRNGAVAGAVGFDTRKGEFYIIKAKAIVIATGECHFKGHYPDQAFATGDGMAMALNAGAELSNLEFTTLWVVPANYGWEGFALAFPLGARLLNSKGESFLEKYSPLLKSKIDYNYLAIAMAIEAREGRSPFHMDFSPISESSLKSLMNHTGWMELNIKKLKEAGIRFDMQEVVPGFYQARGIKTDIGMGTSVPGLFIGGRVRTVEPGIIMGGWSLCSGTAFGYWAGENAGKYANRQESPRIEENEIAPLRKELYSPLGRAGKEPSQLLAEIQKALFNVEVLILKNETALKKALSRIEQLRDEWIPQLGARDVHYLMRLREVRNMVLIAELMLKASLMRTESRASHFREDYPTRNDKDWLKWIVISKKDGKLNFDTQSVPFEKYRFKPTRYYMDNFKIPE